MCLYYDLVFVLKGTWMCNQCFILSTVSLSFLVRAQIHLYHSIHVTRHSSLDKTITPLHILVVFYFALL